ncbi:MAG: hypothetical protein RBT11_18780 [Desulfobacterales bacterium]|jgi:tetratricopeptide (TPR) repeat protein|nr:hypothetical protein [Desulfobacterales bacterium]
MRLRRREILFLIGCLLFCGTMTAFADKDDNLQTRAFIDGVRYYEAKNYTEAVAVFEKLVFDGIRNGKLFYNLGNAYLKKGDLGPAVLWYERAMALISGDPDLQFNLSYAKSLVKDEGGEAPSPVFQVLFFWKDMFRLNVLQWTGILLNGLFWLLLGLTRVFQKSVLRSFCYGALILSVLFLGTAGWRMAETKYHPKAIILPAAVAVRSGFAPESTELFELHGGTKVAVEKQSPGFLKIRFSKDKIGWIADTAAGIIK